MVLTNALDLTANGIVEFNNTTGSFTGHTLTNGQLLIGNTGNPASNAILTGQQGLNIANGPGSITLSNLRNASKYVVATTTSDGQYTTIQSAINAAVSDGVTSSAQAVIWIQPGTYTENLTLHDYVHLYGLAFGATISGNVTYDTGTGPIDIMNLHFTLPNSSPLVSLTGGGNLRFFNCQLDAPTGYCASITNVNSFLQFVACYLSSSYSSSLFSVIDGTLNVYYTTMYCTNYAASSSVTGEGSISILYSYVTDNFTFSNTATGNINFCSITSFTNSILNLGAGTSCIFNNNDCSCTAVSTYFAIGTGIFSYSSVIMLGSAVLIDPGLTILPSSVLLGNALANQIATTPPNSTSSSLALNTAYQNTLGYDIILIVYIAIASATSASILCGVGSSNAPTQQTIVNSITLAALNVIPVTIYLPNNYYAKISTSGTISASISGQQVTPV